MEEVQETLENSKYIQSANDIDYFNASVGNDDVKNSANAYSNDKDYISHNYDIVDVEESKMKDLPAYDFSGPKANLGSGAKTEDDSLLASDESLQNAADEAANSDTTNGQKVYLVPLYSGIKSTSYLARNDNGYQIIAGDKKADYDKYKAALTTFKLGSYTSKDGIGLSYFKGKEATFAETGKKTLSYQQWKLAWNFCYAVGQQLSKDGCQVTYAYKGSASAKSGDKPYDLFGDSATKTLQQIADDVMIVKPDYVIFIGFNDGAYGKVDGTPKTTSTLFAYMNYNKIKNNKFAKSLAKNWKSVSDLMSALPADGAADVTGYSTAEAEVLGMQKMQTALYALKACGYTGKSAGILLGSFNSNLQNGGSYSYRNPSTLNTALSSIISKSL